MHYTSTEEKLMAEMAQMEIIDCHEHLPPEQERTDSPQDVFTMFSHYTRRDLFSSGLDEKAYENLFNYDVPLEQRWKKLKPYWQAIRYGSYARAALLTAKLVYGFDDINEQTYQGLSERIAAENTPGIYNRILCERCRIRLALTQCSRTDVQEPLVPLMPGGHVTQLQTKQRLEELADEIGRQVPANLDEYLDLAKAYLQKWVAEGAVGIKLFSQPNLPPDHKSAEQPFGRLLAGEELIPEPGSFWMPSGDVLPASGYFQILENFLIHMIIDMASELDLVIAVHAGMWGDFRRFDPKHMLSLAPAHPQARFDLYHLGMPFVRDAIVVGKNLPNVFLNLCWTHVISQEQSCSGIDELLDQVPVNKILAFGGDYQRPVEKVVGHLYMARENFARVFGRRIDRGQMSFEQAMEILTLWFWNNPLKLYSRLQID